MKRVFNAVTEHLTQWCGLVNFTACVKQRHLPMWDATACMFIKCIVAKAIVNLVNDNED